MRDIEYYAKRNEELHKELKERDEALDEATYFFHEFIHFQDSKPMTMKITFYRYAEDWLKKHGEK